MTITEIFKSSFETIKSHKKQVIILCLISIITRTVIQVFSGFPTLIVGFFSAFLNALVFLPFISKLNDSKANTKRLIISALSFAVISTVFLIIDISTTLAMQYFPNLFVFPIRLIILIVLTIIEYFGLFSVFEASMPIKSLKLLFSKLKSEFISKVSIIIAISLSINLPLSILCTVIKYNIYIDVTSTIQFKIISVPFYIFATVCMYTHWKSLEKEKN